MKFDVPTCKPPRNVEVAVVLVASKLPTVSCVPVAIKFPEAFVVMIEFAAKVCALKICDASVEVESVCMRPPVPRYAKPCERDVRRTELLKRFTPENVFASARSVELAAPESEVRKPASFVSCDVLMVDVANEYTWPFAPMPAKPPVREPSVRVPTFAVVAEAYWKEPSVVDEFVNICRPVNVFVSARSVDDAAPERDVRKPASLLNQERFTEEDAIVFTVPPVPMYAKPCDKDDSRSDELNVEDAVEKRPPVKPMTLDVELPYVCDVNGNVPERFKQLPSIA
jgi:hypothetical protein